MLRLAAPRTVHSSSLRAASGWFGGLLGRWKGPPTQVKAEEEDSSQSAVARQVLQSRDS